MWAGDESELPLVQKVRNIAEAEGSEVLVICARAEEEIAQLDPEDKQMFLEDMGLAKSGLDRLVKLGYHLLGLISFLTAGPKEVRAWTIPEGTRAPQAAGKIHSDFERGFIRAEIVAYDDLCARAHERLQGKGPGALRGQGLRDEGRRRDAVPLQRLSFLKRVRQLFRTGFRSEIVRFSFFYKITPRVELSARHGAFIILFFSALYSSYPP